MNRETRHQLKHDEFKDTLVSVEEFLKNHFKEVLNATIIAVVVLGLAGGLKYYTDQQESNANADLGEALSTFRASVGPPTPGQNDPEGSTYPTAEDKYKKALQQFDAILDQYKMPPRPKAVEIARYQAGLCQSLLGDHNGAVQTLSEASQSGDAEIAALAKFALAGEMAKSAKTSEAVKLYQDLADHPTVTVPKASALLAMADAYRLSNPAEARKIYARVQTEFASNASVATAVKQEMASLNP